MSPPPDPNLFLYTSPTPFQQFTKTPLSFLTTHLYTHLPAVTSPPPSLPPIKLVCISDTHTSRPPLSHGAVLLHADDLSINGTYTELQTAIDWLASQPHAYKFVVAGNHDLLLDEESYEAHAGRFARKCDKGKSAGDLGWGGVVYLDSSAAEVEVGVEKRKLSIFADGATSRNGNWAFQYARRRGYWRDRVPEGTELLVAHGPARGHLDWGGEGCVSLLGEAWRVRPRVIVYGHVHAGREREVLDWGVVQWFMTF